MAGYPGGGGRGGVAQLVTQVELRVECRSLRNRDTMSKSDPCAVLYMHTGDKWREEGRTESITNDLDPKFVTAFSLDYYFETVQNVKVAVYDLDNSSGTLKDDDFLGKIEFTLGQVVSRSPFTQHLLNKDGEKQGDSSITIRVEEIKEGSESVEMLFRAEDLDNKDFMGKSDPFLQISARNADGSLQVVEKTEMKKNDLNPRWKKVTVRLNTLCGGDMSRPILLDVFDWDSDGSHDIIGGCETTVEEMLEVQESGEVTWPCINEKKKAKKKKYKDSGLLILDKCEITKEYSFLDYVFGGLQISLSFAIDFTGSNGNPCSPDSLHYIDPERPNEYQQAINAVGTVVQDYDSDKLFPVLGFGAALPPTGQVHFEFAVNFNPQNPYCAGIMGVQQAYQTCIRQVQLSGPTNVAPIINHVARFAWQAQQLETDKGAAAYFILLLLTDGAVTDVAETVEAVVTASSLPLSIIIVGVGDADFGLMDFLDGDDGTLKSQGKSVERDIVQFVPFRDFRDTSPDQLSRHVLAEIPNQVTEYFSIRGLPPNEMQPAPPQ